MMLQKINLPKIQEMISQAEGVFIRQADDSNALYIHEGEVLRIILEYAHGIVSPDLELDEVGEEVWEDDTKMILVQGGTFTMGATKDEERTADSDEKPAHEVTLSDFYIGKYPVTQKEWIEVMGSNPSCFRGDKLPVETVSWDDAQEFISKLNTLTGKTYRLPTEAEWEFAARGGIRSQGFRYAGSDLLDEVAWYVDSTTQVPWYLDSMPHPVGQKKPNELGLYDMSGNVWEWCNDLYDDYQVTAQTNPQGPSTGYYRVNRGGASNLSSHHCRNTKRSYSHRHFRFNYMGFRLAMSV